jgi:hypothetical protein
LLPEFTARLGLGADDLLDRLKSIAFALFLYNTGAGLFRINQRI